MIRKIAPLLTASALTFAACKSEPPPEPPPPPKPVAVPAVAKAVEIDATRLAAFQPLPTEMLAEGKALNDAQIELGRMLYFDKRLSKNHDVSCNSCHGLDKYGVDGKPVSNGHKNQVGTRNSPTVYNAAMHIAQFWDLRAASVEEQAKGPILNPVEMAMPDEKKVVATLKSIPGYVDAFKKAFPDTKDALTYDNLAVAIGAFERRLVTPAKWDKFLGGDKTALNDEEKAGFNKFVESGCMSCHFGANLGGGMAQKLGLVQPWPNQKDQGKFEVTKADADKMIFKVPGLRNVAMTAPYYHDGSVATLDEAVKLMAKHQVGRELTDADSKSIVTFLGTLTGELPTAYIQEPKLPENGPKTPKPDPS
jgi:cytochrome c peroxidase